MSLVAEKHGVRGKILISFIAILTTLGVGLVAQAGMIVKLALKAPPDGVSALSIRPEPAKPDSGLESGGESRFSTPIPPIGAAAGWKYLPAVDLYIVDDTGKDLLNTLQKNGGVEAAEESSDIQLEALPDDPMFDDQGWTGGMGLDIGASSAWDITTGDADVTVAIIDTGIAVNHRDLAPNLWTNDGEIPGNGRDDDGNGFEDDVHGYNFWNGNPDVTDRNNHGSHLAGIIGGVGDNGIGIAGVGWRTRLMALRFTDENGNGSSSKAIEAIDYAIRNGAQIINASWTLKLDGGPGPKTDGLMGQAIRKASEAGILFVTASGNQFETGVGLNIDDSPVYPSSLELGNIVSVTALDAFGRLADYANYGAASVDLAAPGSYIYSTAADGSYLAMTGTSIATAVVSGAAALVLSARHDLTAEQLKAVLENSVVLDDSLTGKVTSGGGLNLYNSVQLAQSGSLPESSPSSAPRKPVEAPLASQGLNIPSSGGCSLVR